MKRIMLIAVFAIASSYVWGISSLVLTADGNLPFTAILAAERYDVYQGELRVTSLMPGNYSIEIIKNQRTSHRDERRGRRHGCTTISMIDIPNNATVFARVGFDNRVVITRIEMLPTSHRTDNYSDGRRQMRDPGHPRSSCAPQARAMDEYAFRGLLQTLQNEAFDSDKLLIARRALDNNFLYTSQIEDLTRLFAFDDSRLSVLKMAYSRCLDCENFYRTYSLLTFSSSKQNLDQYLAHR